MMVSKVAVVALVAIVACPILLGYGMNLQETTHTEYSLSENIINVTDLLKNGDVYNNAHADIYTLNTNILTAYDQKAIMPLYQKQTSSSSALAYSIGFTPGWTGGAWVLSDSTYVLLDYDISQGSVTARVETSSNVVLQTINNVIYTYYDKDSNSITYTYYNTLTEVIEEGYIPSGTHAKIRYVLNSLPGVDTYYGLANAGNVDLSAGFRLSNVQTSPIINLPGLTRSYLMTINLNSITDPNYTMCIRDAYGQFYLYKTTTAGVVTWECSGNNGRQQIYYDPSSPNNTYQFSNKFIERYELNNRLYIKTHAEMRYIGAWPTLFGEVQPYLTYEFDKTTSQPVGDNWDSTDHGFENIRLEIPYYYDDAEFTPIVRMDDATFQAFRYSIIQNKTYDPATFRNNPATKIADIGKYGSFITFGGVRYDVTDGNITLGTHDVSIKNLVFKSEPVAGGYANKINDLTISTTGTPSKIIFGGEWGATVLTDSMELTTYTKTEWTPGEFAWNGIDQNFLMIGLLAALGVFIALGLAYRKVKSALFALLVVCGGAVLLFFTML